MQQALRCQRPAVGSTALRHVSRPALCRTGPLPSRLQQSLGPNAPPMRPASPTCSWQPMGLASSRSLVARAGPQDAAGGSHATLTIFSSCRQLACPRRRRRPLPPHSTARTCCSRCRRARGAQQHQQHGKDAHPGPALRPLVPLQHSVQHVRGRTCCRNWGLAAVCSIALSPPPHTLPPTPILPRPHILPFAHCSYNKQVLRVFPYPLTLTTLQFLVGGAIAGTMWLTGLHKRPEGDLAETVGGSCGVGAMDKWMGVMGGEQRPAARLLSGSIPAPPAVPPPMHLLAAASSRSHCAPASAPRFPPAACICRPWASPRWPRCTRWAMR